MAARTIFRSCMQSSHTAPAVRIFLQLASCRPLPVLDFLAPGVAQSPPPIPLRSLPKSGSRTFSTTSALKETIAIYNARKDDDGHDMNVEITPRASMRLREIMTKDENPNLALRITVESGGCHGFQYLMSLTTLPPLPSSPPALSSASASIPEESCAPALNTSSSDPNASPSSSSTPSTSQSGSSTAASPEASVDDDDTVFKALDGSEAKVVMDGPSLELLKGSKIDYTMELIGSQFKIVDNPLATSSCGCGTSFDIKT